MAVQLIVESKDSNSVICGYIRSPEGEQPTTCDFNNPIKLCEDVNMSDVHIAIEQEISHPPNNGKMISIRAGQCATRCKCLPNQILLCESAKCELIRLLVRAQKSGE